MRRSQEKKLERIIAQYRGGLELFFINCETKMISIYITNRENVGYINKYAVNASPRTFGYAYNTGNRRGSYFLEVLSGIVTVDLNCSSYSASTATK